MYTIKQVYVAGGMPVITYVDRKVQDKKQELIDAIDTHKLITVTGNTKTGKTVLVNKLFPKDKHIWIDSGTIKTESDFWDTIGEFCSLYETIEKSTEFGTEISGEVNTSGEANVLFAKATAQLSGSLTGSATKTATKSRTANKKVIAIQALRQNKHVLIIDDFHYIERSLQQSIVRALKGLIFDGLNVICIAIPHRKYDAIMVEREMNGRVAQVSIPQWEKYELIEIAKAGENPLNIKYENVILESLANEALGSPHLMQEFLIAVLKRNKIENTQSKTIKVSTMDKGIFEKIANDTGNEVFKKLAYGPRQRSDRKERILKNGKTVDIYKLVILTLIELKPGLIKINYIPDIRNAMKKIIDELPQINEVSRIFEKMKEIALTDNSSVPVLEWNKTERELIITDPFFALYLKYGKLE
jgi:hypothetical protein